MFAVFLFKSLCFNRLPVSLSDYMSVCLYLMSILFCFNRLHNILINYNGLKGIFLAYLIDYLHVILHLLKMSSNPTKARKKSKSSKRKQVECSQAALNRLVTWFTNENKKIDFKMIYVVKNVRILKFLNLEWFSHQGFNFPNLLEAQGLSKFVQMKGTFYPKLVKVFYTCVCANMEGNMYSTVNGVEMVIDAEVWKVVAGIDMGGVCKFEESMDGYNKMRQIEV